MKIKMSTVDYWYQPNNQIGSEYKNYKIVNLDEDNEISEKDFTGERLFVLGYKKSGNEYKFIKNIYELSN